MPFWKGERDLEDTPLLDLHSIQQCKAMWPPSSQKILNTIYYKKRMKHASSEKANFWTVNP